MFGIMGIALSKRPPEKQAAPLFQIKIGIE